MIVTINTDASWNKEHQIGTFAFWIVCNEGKIHHAGVLRKKVSRPEIGEFRCIINALHVLAKQNWKYSKIIVNTDCLNVIHLVTNDKVAIRRWGLETFGKPLMEKLKLLLIQMKVPGKMIDFRHVPAHKGVGTKRQYVNDWCDRMAKEQMKIKLQSLKKVA